MRYVEMALLTVLHMGTIAGFAVVVSQAQPEWSYDRVMLWSLIFFVVAWRAASEARKS